MHEVRVYDNLGNLKKVISVKTLKKRAEQQIQTPSLFRKDRKNAKQAKASQSRKKAATS